MARLKAVPFGSNRFNNSEDFHMTRSAHCPLILFLILVGLHTGAASAPIDGRWLTADGTGWIDIRTEDNVTRGFIAGSPEDPDDREPQELDQHNPDPELRTRPLTGIQIITDLQQRSDTKWQGNIYDPNSGKTYKCTLKLTDADTLKLRGYLGVSLFGRTEVWTRVD